MLSKVDLIVRERERYFSIGKRERGCNCRTNERGFMNSFRKRGCGHKDGVVEKMLPGSQAVRSALTTHPSVQS